MPSVWAENCDSGLVEPLVQRDRVSLIYAWLLCEHVQFYLTYVNTLICFSKNKTQMYNISVFRAESATTPSNVSVVQGEDAFVPVESSKESRRSWDPELTSSSQQILHLPACKYIDRNCTLRRDLHMSIVGPITSVFLWSDQVTRHFSCRIISCMWYYK